MAETNGKKKAGRPKKGPTPPMLGIAERSGQGYRIVIALGGLVVNGKKFDPQVGADNLADMFVYCMRVQDADPADQMVAEANGEDLPALETAMPAADGADA